jgi:hypothetical protein
VSEPFPDSICHGCVHLELVRSKRGSVFLMCQAPSLPKYPRQPVLQCASRKPRLP